MRKCKRSPLVDPDKRKVGIYVNPKKMTVGLHETLNAVLGEYGRRPDDRK